MGHQNFEEIMGVKASLVMTSAFVVQLLSNGRNESKPEIQYSASTVWSWHIAAIQVAIVLTAKQILTTASRPALKF